MGERAIPPVVFLLLLLGFFNLRCGRFLRCFLDQFAPLGNAGETDLECCSIVIDDQMTNLPASVITHIDSQESMSIDHSDFSRNEMVHTKT